jgi:hypothetical protein
MPIRINLLAEQQAAEELRRKDPVKRGVILAVFIAVLLVGYCVWGWLQVRSADAQLEAHEGRQKAVTNVFSMVTSNLGRVKVVEDKLRTLQYFTTNRFFWAPPLGALQSVTLPDVFLIRIEGRNTYNQLEEIKPVITAGVTNNPGRPKTSVEKVTLSLTARDYGSEEEQNFSKFRNLLLAYPYFKSSLVTNGVGLENLGTPTRDDVDKRRTFVEFVLQCSYPPFNRTNVIRN